MIWKVLFHPLVAKEDLPALGIAARRQILKSIHKKLTLDPEAHGEPLRKELFGYWKLKAGDYRVIYKMEKDTVIVFIFKIGMRKDSLVYSEMISRLKKVLK